MMTLILWGMGLTAVTLWLSSKLAFTMRDYSYKYEFRGEYSSFKYKIIVYYKDDIIYSDDMQMTTLFGYPRMIVQALSHKRRKGLNV